LTVVPKTDLWQSGSRLKTNQTVEFMSHNIHNPQGVGNCQDPCKVDLSLPIQPTGGALWNSAIGRRTFLKRTGGATLATALALHGTGVQVYADSTGLVEKPIYDRYEHTYFKNLPGAAAPSDENDSGWESDKESEIDIYQLNQEGVRRTCPSPGSYTRTTRKAYFSSDSVLKDHWQKITVTILGVGSPDAYGAVDVEYSVVVENWYTWALASGGYDGSAGPLDETGCSETDPGSRVGPPSVSVE